jgi:hypothetical protein
MLSKAFMEGRFLLTFGVFFMMRQPLLIAFHLLIASLAFAQTGDLKGKVMDKATLAVIDDASVAVYYGDSVYATSIPDFGGNYSFSNLPLGRITIVCSKESYATLIDKNIPIAPGKATTIELKLRKSNKSNDIDLVEYKDAEVQKEEVVKETQPASPPIVVQRATQTHKETITLLADSQVVKGSIKQGYYFKIGNGEPEKLKFFAGNLSPYLFQTPEAYSELNKYKSIKATKFGLQIAFAGLAGIYAGSFFFDKKNDDFFKGYRVVLLGGAVACFGVSAFLDEIKDKHLKRAIDKYNASVDASH